VKRARNRLFQLPSDKTEHGGDLCKGRRKEARPFVPKAKMHLVLRSKKACGEYSFLRKKNAPVVFRILKTQSKKHHVRVYDFVNVGNHLHIKIKAYSRETFQAFLKSSTALIARAITGAKKGRPFGKFWDGLAYTRRLKSSKEEFILKRYFTANFYESEFGRMARNLYLAENPIRRWRTEVVPI